MLALGTLLAQVVPPTAATPVTGFTGDLPVTEVTTIFVCNTTGSTVSFSIYHDDSGTTYNNTTALYRLVNLAANSTTKVEFHGAGGGIAVRNGGTIGLETSTDAALTFSIYGVTARVTGQQL